MSTNKKSTWVRTEVLDKGEICVITIDRPEALNALNAEVVQELKSVFDSLEAQGSVRVVILTGAGEKAFIAGADIKEMSALGRADAVDFAHSGQEVTRLIQQYRCPVIAAVNGYALGGGTELALACDFILASKNAVFGQPEVQLGVIPGFGGTVRLGQFVGMARAKELIFSGRKVKAEEALSIGLCNHIYDSSELMNEALKLARSISANAADAVAATKRLLNEFSNEADQTYQLDAEAQEFGALFGQKDQVEGMNAFLEKRKPNFHKSEREGSAV